MGICEIQPTGLPHFECTSQKLVIGYLQPGQIEDPLKAIRCVASGELVDLRQYVCEFREDDIGEDRHETSFTGRVERPLGGFSLGRRGGIVATLDAGYIWDGDVLMIWSVKGSSDIENEPFALRLDLDAGTADLLATAMNPNPQISSRLRFEGAVHSGFGTYSLLIEADAKRLFYSADFQGHGRKWKIFKEFLRKPPTDVDVLLMEGTNIPPAGVSEKPTITESDVEAECVKTFRSTEGPVLAVFSAQNIDRLVTMYRAAKRSGRLFVMDFYLACVARASGRKSVTQPDWEDVRVFLPYNQKKSVIKSQEFERVEWVKEARIYPEELKSLASKLVIAFRSSMAKDLEKADCLEGATLVWSLWPGYLQKEKRLTTFCESKAIPFKIHHASGHAHVEDLKKYAAAVNPRRLTPIHTAAASRFHELFENVELHSDGEWWDV